MKSLAIFPLAAALFFLFSGASAFAAEDPPAYPKGELALNDDQYAEFPLPLAKYEVKENANVDWGIWEKLKYRATEQGGFNIVATIICLLYTSPSPRDRG